MRFRRHLIFLAFFVSCASIQQDGNIEDVKESSVKKQNKKENEIKSRPPAYGNKIVKTSEKISVN